MRTKHLLGYEIAMRENWNWQISDERFVRYAKVGTGQKLKRGHAKDFGKKRDDAPPHSRGLVTMFIDGRVTGYDQIGTQDI